MRENNGENHFKKTAPQFSKIKKRTMPFFIWNIENLQILDFSDQELVQLAQLLQNKLDTYDANVPMEDYDVVLVPVELMNEPQNEHMLRTLVRDRRSEPIIEPILQEEPSESEVGYIFVYI